MKYVFVLVFLFGLFSLCFSSSTQAQQRYASCDSCGLCIELREGQATGWRFKQRADGTPVIPELWPSCVKCLYKEAENDPLFQKTIPKDQLEAFVTQKMELTLKITDNSTENPGQPPPPRKDKYFTQLGCIPAGDGPEITVLVVGQLLRIVQGVAGTIGFGVIVYASIRMLLSRGEPDKINASKKMLIDAIVGTAFTVFAVFVVQFLAADVLKIPGIK
jgi:hypothetical protein